MQTIYLTFLILSFITLLFYKAPKLGAFFGFGLSALISLISSLYFLTHMFETHSFSLGSGFLFTPNFLLEPIGNFFSFIVCFIAFICAIFSIKYVLSYAKKANLAVFASLFNTFVLSMLLVISANNVFSFIVLWELMTLISALLIMVDDNKFSQKAVMMYLGIAQIGAFCIVCALVILGHFAGSFEFSQFDKVSLTPALNLVVFLLFFIGFASKAGLFPLHVWLPLAHPVAPSNISALMSGVMLKVAIFVFIKFSLFLEISTSFAYICLVLGGITALVCMLYAAIQNNYKVAIAYSSCENIGIIFMGIGTCFYGLATSNSIVVLGGALATFYHILNHSVFKSLLFLGSGAVHSATHTFDMNKLGGLDKKMPKISILMLVGVAGAAALPPLNGFASEWVLYKSMLAGGVDVSVASRAVFILCILALGVTGALAVMCYSKIYGAIFSGVARDKEIEKHAKDGDKFMVCSMGVLAVCVVLLGVFMSEICEFILNIIKTIPRFSAFEFNRSEFISLPLVFVLLAFLSVLPLWVLWVLKSNSLKPRLSEPWACGFKYSPNMQIGSNPYTGDLRKVFSFFYRTKSVVKTTDYFAKVEYKSKTKEVVYNYIYEPVIKFCIFLADKIGAFQNGRTNAYAAYILAYLCLVLVLGYYFL
ncbi:proton-conducting transporter membrane subunit [Campylobacter geochelonis]|uniref:proton-conducting transporter transmembrane domain-containing protein n=1 Tax=Campylobacter geochelonis TaxID=1780362 RepID=UPI0007709080|nr:proton-conducting transporter membrane subunit [Campylobacter geochelonis]CZE45988.1 ATP-binding protein [Campylobacter geochelonis]